MTFTIKNISILGPYRAGDIWSIPLSFYYELKRLGLNVKIYNNLNEDQPGITQLNPKAWTEDGLRQLLYEANNNIFVPDVIIHFDFGLFRSSLLNKANFPKAKWIYESGDDPQCFNYNLAKVRTGNFDLVMSPDIRAVSEYKKLHFNAVWSPHFADPMFLGKQIEPTYDAVTSRHFSEPFFVELKQKLGERFLIRDEFINEKDHLMFLKQGKIVIQNSKYKEITRRVFEGMLSNRLVITDRIDPSTQIDLLFKEDKDIVYFDNLADCVEKINFYVKNKEEREKIAASGHQKVKNQHTIQTRVKKLLELL